MAELLYIVHSIEGELYGLRDELEALEQSGGLGFPVSITLAGVGPEQAGRRMAEILAQGAQRPQRALMLGVAGAVEPGMETGDLLLASSYMPDSGEETARGIAPDPEMLALAEAAAAEARMPVNQKPSLTVNHLVAELWEREHLRRKYSVGSVNMEDHAAASAAASAGVPFLSARVVLDTAEQRLPGYLTRLVRGRSAVLTEVIMQPWRIPALRRIKSQMDLCQSVLTRFGMAYLKLEAERRRSNRGEPLSEASC